MFRGAARVCGLCVALSFCTVSATPPAQAHDVVLASTPADGSTVDVFPREISLEFSGVPQKSFNTVAVSDSATSAVLFTAQPEINGPVVSVTVPEDVQPGPGDYMVGFQITSSDGHATRGKTTFTVAGDATSVTSPATSTAPTTSPSAGAASESSHTSLFIWGIGVIGLLAVIAVVGALLKNRTK